MTGWLALRRMVYRRDGGICQVCLLPVGRVWDAGHLVDRCVGGDNTLSNLCLMCARCNRSEKPIHRTLEEALEWLQRRRDLASGRELRDDWRGFYRAMYGRT